VGKNWAKFIVWLPKALVLRSHIIVPTLLNWWHHLWMKSIAWSNWGSTSQSPWCIVESLPALLEKSKFYVSGKWSPEKYILDDSLNVTRIRKGGKVKVRNEKKCGPLTHVLALLGLPTHKKLAPPLFREGRLNPLTPPLNTALPYQVKLSQVLHYPRRWMTTYLLICVSRKFSKVKCTCMGRLWHQIKC